MSDLKLFIDFAIICLLVPTIIYAYRLNKNLNILRTNQASMAKLIENLNDATTKAERSIPKLKSATEHSSIDLKEVVASAKSLKDDLAFMNERADGLADRLESIIKESRNVKEKEDKPAKKVSPLAPKEKHQEEAPFVEDSRSLAEMELLKALRSIK